MGKKIVIKGADFSGVCIKENPVIKISTLGQVTISSLGSSVIYYTTDGSTPTSGSNVYSGAFDVVYGTTVKAIALFLDGTYSSVSSEIYDVISINYKIGWTSNWTTGVIEENNYRAVTQLIQKGESNIVNIVSTIDNPNAETFGTKALFYVIKCFDVNGDFIGNATPTETHVGTTTVFDRTLLEGTTAYKIVIAYNDYGTAMASHIYDNALIYINGQKYVLVDGII